MSLYSMVVTRFRVLICFASMARTSLAILIVVIAGCVPLERTPCALIDVDDDDPCTIDRCFEGWPPVVDHIPVECSADMVCDPDTGDCVEEELP
ncbi:MAG: hypothetical protein JSV78_10635 [Phycisphaerales bacterium]|nr:MAG: hypothetical protein JSV78_10635 [Phycisphaerales bacterium]